MSSRDYAVLIGRFQPFHAGHLGLFKSASAGGRHVIIVIGSHNAPLSIRNPWSTAEREQLIRLSLGSTDPSSYTIAPVRDSAYNLTDWVIRVQQTVASIAGDNPVTLVGHFKDDTSYYLNHFPQWKLETLPSQSGGVSSTAIRTACFEERLTHMRSAVAEAAYDEIARWTTGERFRRLQEEYQFIAAYRRTWESAPFPPAFVTADSVVMALGHVLLIRRKINPGKGRLALPGGFVRAAETIERTCMRELKEQTALDIGYKELQGSMRMSNVFDHPLRDPRGRVISHAFMYELMVKELPSVRGCADAAEASWCPLYRLDDHESEFFNDHAQIVRYFTNRAF